MRLRIIKTHKKNKNEWYYAVQKKYWLLGWMVTGGIEFSSGDQLLSLEEAEDILNEYKETAGKGIVIKEIVI